LKNKIEICDYEADFFCPMCGAKVVDSVTPKIQACEHLQYASFSEAPGMPEHIAEGLIGSATTSCNERENVERVCKSVESQTLMFELVDCSGLISMYLVFAPAEN